MFRKKHFFCNTHWHSTIKSANKRKAGYHMKLRPLGDRVVLQYKDIEEKTESEIILPDSAKKKSNPM